jgi:hypothetical protein
MELKITGNQEKLTLQNKTHILESETRKIFKTNKIDSLKCFLKDHSKSDINVSAYYNETSISVWPCSADGDLNRNDEPVAVCNFETTDELKILSKHINKDINEKNFCEFLRIMSKYVQGAIALKDAVENMSIKKIVSMEKSKDNRGNHSYHYTVKDHGKTDFNPPNRLVFQIPVFKHITNKISFDLELVFNYRMVGVDENRHAECMFRLEILNLDQFLESAFTAVIEKQMESFDFPKYWGSLETVTKTDDWKYKDVPLMFQGLPEDKNITTIENKRSY